MKSARWIGLVCLLGFAGCADPHPGTPAASSAWVAHVRITNEGASAEDMNQAASTVAKELIHSHFAARVTTIATFDTGDLYIMPAAGFDDVKRTVAEAIALHKIQGDISPVTRIPASGVPRGIGVVRMRTIAFNVDRDALAKAGLEIENVAAAVRQIYPENTPATDQMVAELRELTLKNSQGDMVPFTSVATMTLEDVEDPIVRSYP